MNFGLRRSQPACRPHPASLPISCSYGREFATRCFQLHLSATPCVSLRLPSSAPVGSFHPTSFCPCWAHWGRMASCRRLPTGDLPHPPKVLSSLRPPSLKPSLTNSHSPH